MLKAVVAKREGVDAGTGDVFIDPGFDAAERMLRVHIDRRLAIQ